jgi:hypothetical protein
MNRGVHGGSRGSGGSKKLRMLHLSLVAREVKKHNFRAQLMILVRFYMGIYDFIDK